MAIDRLPNLPSGADVFLDATVRSSYGLLTNDSLILAAMSDYGIDSLATRDGDFDHVPTLTVYKPTDV